MSASLLVALVCAPAAVAEAQRTHRVRSGESFARIARRYHVSVWDLALANHARPSHHLHPGQQLDIPGEGEVYVRPGYSLGRIARNNHTSVRALRRHNHLRSNRVRVGQRLMLPGHERRPRRPRDWGQPDEPGVLTLQSPREGGDPVRVRLRDEAGRVPQAGLDQLAVLMRRHEEDALRTPDARLALLLSVISDHFGGRAITIVSGFREARRFTSRGSQHVSGHATDIRVEGVGRRALFDFCRSIGHTGCGYYPHSTFVHVDAREEATQWVDWSRPGRRPRYGTLRRPYRRRERRSHRRPRVTRHVTAPNAVPLQVEVAAAPTRESDEVPGG